MAKLENKFAYSDTTDTTREKNMSAFFIYWLVFSLTWLSQFYFSTHLTIIDWLNQHFFSWPFDFVVIPLWLGLMPLMIALPLLHLRQIDSPYKLAFSAIALLSLLEIFRNQFNAIEHSTKRLNMSTLFTSCFTIWIAGLFLLFIFYVLPQFFLKLKRK